jgi:phosphoribosylglycinamide formyltransferase-1
MKVKKIAVFISGRGSNFKAIATEVNRGKINAVLDVVISDNPDAAGLKYAHKQEIEYVVFKKKKDQSRSDYFVEISEFLKRRKIDLIVLAGFMKVLSSNIIEEYRHRILNIHPALLPSFPGVHAQKQALEYGVKYSGCTVHFIDEGIDSGPIILQEVVPVFEDDTEDTLSARILEKEHTIYPNAVKLFCENRLIIEGRRVFIKQPQ